MFLNHDDVTTSFALLRKPEFWKKKNLTGCQIWKEGMEQLS
jgi:hypothetical protein